MRAITYVHTHSRPILIVSLLIVIFGIVSVGSLEWTENVMELLPRDDPVVSGAFDLADRFEVMDYVYLDIGPSDHGGDLAESELIVLADELYRRLDSSDRFKRIIYRWDAAALQGAIERLARYRASLFTDDDAERLADRLTYEAVYENLAEWKRLLTESPAPLMSNALYEDPLRIDELFIGKLDAVRSGGMRLDLRGGRLFSEDGRHVLIMAIPDFPATDTRRGRDLIAFLGDVIRTVERGDASGRVRVSHFGGHLASLENAASIKADIKLTVTLSVVAIAALSLLVYRRWWLVLLTFVPVFFGGTFALGVVRCFDPYISAITIGCGSMLIGISVDYAVHVLYAADRLAGRTGVRKEMIRVVERLYVPILLSAATTFGAFCILHFSVLPGYRSLGHFAAPGIIAAALFSITVLPILVVRLPGGRGRGPVCRLTGFFSSILSHASRHRSSYCILVTVVSLLALVGLGRLGFEGDIQKLNSITPQTRLAWEGITDRFGEMMSSTAFAVRGSDLEEALGKSEMLAAHLKSTRESANIAMVSTVAELMPSQRTQVKNRRRWEIFWNEERLGELREHVERACRELRMRPEAFAEFFESLPGSTPPIVYEDYSQGLLGDLLSAYVSPGEDDVVVLTRVKLKDAGAFEALAGDMKRHVPGIIAYNGSFFVRHVVELIYREMIRLGAITLCFIVVVLLLFVRRLGLVAAILLPLFVSMLWTLGCLGWLGVRLNLMNSVVAVFVFALVVDYGIFLTMSLRGPPGADREHVPQTCGAILISALTTMCGMGALVFARHPALHSIGVTAILAIGSGLLAVFTIVPLLGRRNGERST